MLFSSFLWGASSTEPSSRPAFAATEPAGATVAAEARKLRVKGIEQALSGQMVEGLALIAKAGALVPDDPSNASALKLIRDHLSRISVYRKERADEYAREVRRVDRAVMAQKHLPELVKTGIDKKLHEKITDLVSAYNRCGDSESLEHTTDNEAEALRTEVSEDLDVMSGLVGEAERLIEEDRSEYAETFRSHAGEVLEQLLRYKRTWKAADVGVVKQRRIAARKLRRIENSLDEALSDLGSLTGKEPWRSALLHARIAKQIAPETEEPTSQQWYLRLIADVDTRAGNAVRDAEWYEALNAYRGLAKLDPDNEHYQDMVAKVTRHARVLSLYGKTPTTRPAENDDENEPVAWRELVAGVDPATVRQAIRQLSDNYVTAVDYRKVTCGALTSLKVLLETPQAVESFPTLKDQGRRGEFLNAIGAMIDNVEKKDRVNADDLRAALKDVWRASERTVGIPIEVIATEFADGMLDQLDKFSSMIWPSEVSEFEKHTLGHFCGIGIRITKRPGEPLKVVTPLAGSPAHRKGVKTGDLILKVGDEETRGHSLRKLVDMIQGKKGTWVTLQIRRPGVQEPFDVSVKRDEVHIRTVHGWHRRPDGRWDYMIDPGAKVGYVRITQFTGETRKNLVRALEQMRSEGVRSLVLDLRFNPGGLLKSATGVADEFLRAGLIVSTRGRKTGRRKTKATRKGKYLDGDVVVLVNQASASAAEILSGALKDLGRAVVVGERTYGKGSVQNLIHLLPHRSVLKLTTDHYYLPTGRLLHRENGSKTWGVDPDVEVKVTPSQRKRWLKIRGNTDLIQDIDPADLRVDLAEQFDADLQLQTAVLLLKLMQLQDAESAVASAR